MAYIGNTQNDQNYAPAVDYFNGDGSTTAFTLSRPVASVAQVQVVISNVPQNPGSAFTVSGSTITFTSAPPSGTANIYVYYTSPNTQVVQPGQGTVGTAQLVSGVLTPAAVSDQINTATGYFSLPSGTTAQRPSTLVAGQMRYNTTTNQTEIYSGIAWIAITSQTYSIETLVIAGGGGGAAGGGGGAGGYRSSVQGESSGGGGSAEAASTVTVGAAYTITVGAGGAAGSGGSGGSGSNASIIGTGVSITSIGGGFGGSDNDQVGSGGSGGGGGTYGGGGTSGGAGTANQGYAGGNSPSLDQGGGGGGAGAVGQAGGAGANGGIGVISSITGSGTYRAGGGGGSKRSGASGNVGSGGNGGGGAGNGSGGATATSGTANTGGGGGGCAGYPGFGTGGAGGSGVVIIRYAGVQRATGGTVTSAGGYTIHTFTTSGTFTA